MQIKVVITHSIGVYTCPYSSMQALALLRNNIMSLSAISIHDLEGANL